MPLNKNFYADLRAITSLMLLLLGLALLFFGNRLADPHMAASLRPAVERGKSETVVLPHATTQHIRYTTGLYTVTLQRTALTSNRFNIASGGCLRQIYVNDFALDMSGFTPAERCDNPAGINVNLATHLKRGKNTLTIAVDRVGRPYGLDIQPQAGPLFYASGLCFLALTMQYVFALARYLGLCRRTAFMLIAALPYYCVWFYFAADTYKSNDVMGHIGYTRHIVNQWFSPYTYWGREHFHPPLYYYITAILITLSSYIPHVSPFTPVRILALCLYTTFCFYALLTFRLAVKGEGRLYHTGVFLILFWPTSFFLATRISNDIAIYAVWAAIFYYTLRFTLENHAASFRRAIIALALALMIKSSAVVPLGIMGSCILFALYTGKIHWRSLWSRDNVVPYLLLTLGGIINIGKMLYQWLINNLDVSNTHFGRGFRALHRKGFLTSFDFKFYLRHPYDAIGGEPGFANNLMKTALYGEFTWRFSYLASLINLLFLAFLILTLTHTALSLRKKHLAQQLFPYISAVILTIIALMLFYSIKHLTVCVDFRFVVPVLVPLIILFVRSTQALNPPKFYENICMAIALSFPLLAILHYLAHYF